jgi:SAM-dependent methyltransferase
VNRVHNLLCSSRWWSRRAEHELVPFGVDVVQGDATALPFPDGRFSTVLCFTMLHHIPTASQQDQAFGEVARVVRSGGTFAGTDSIGTGCLFQAIHVGEERPLEAAAPYVAGASAEGSASLSTTCRARGRP